MTNVARDLTRSVGLRAFRRRFHHHLLLTVGVVTVSLVGSVALMLPASNASAGGGIFHTICGYSHSLPDDPIVFPNVSGRSHMHDFGGNTTTNASSTLASLQAGTTNCFVHAPDPQADRSGYWVPQLYFNGNPISFVEQQAYYQSGGLPYVNTPPTGLKLVAGKHFATAPLSTEIVKWTCSGSAGDAIGGSDHPPVCPSGSMLKIVVFTPNCLTHTLVANGADGVNDTSQSTYSFLNNGACPTGFDPIVQARIEVKYPPGIDGRGTIAFAPDPGSPRLFPYYSMHADWFNAWDHTTLRNFVQGCVDAGVDCGNTMPPAVVSVTTTGLPSATRGSAYTTTLHAIGGKAPYRWKKLGPLPKGLRLSSTGTISGTPMVRDRVSSYAITFAVRDASKPRQTATATLTLSLS
jgi:hypothetical protein